MICDSKLNYALSNLGWVDKGNLWIYNSLKDDLKFINLSDSKYLSIYEGLNDYFSICHNFDDTRFNISIHNFNDPEHILCKFTFNNFKTEVEGNQELIKYISKYYLASLQLNGDFKFHLISIRDGEIKLDDSKIEWFYNGNFDFMYQGLIGVTESNDELLFCVQRQGNIFRISKETNQLIDKIDLANRYGNPKISFNKDRTALYADDYDTLLRINPLNWKIEKASLLQSADKGTQQFIGSFLLNKNNDLITVARPFSSDVIMVDETLKIRYHCMIGKQPLEAIVFSNKKVVARDWKTGNLLTGRIKHKYFA